MRTLFSLFVFFTLIIAGCTTRIPEPMPYPYTQQQKSQAAGHWNVLAKDVAGRINEQLVLTGNADKSLFVEYNCGSDALPCKANETSPFNEAFRDLLITSLYDLRIPTKVEPSEKALEVKFKVQIVRHVSRRLRTLQPGVITALSAGIAVIRNAPTSLLILASGSALDAANTSLAHHGHYEIIITTSIAERGEYFFRSSDIYYINDPDFWHYMETFPDSGQITFSSRTRQEKTEAEKRSRIPTVIPIPPPPTTAPSPTAESRKEKI